MQYPDFSRDFVLTTDASGIALGAVRLQGEIGKDLPVAYASRVLNDAERKYSVTDQESLAVLWGVEYFRPYLYGKKFYLASDHRALSFMQSKKDPNSRVARWRLRIADYEYEFIFKDGASNVNADALSRNPVLFFEAVPVRVSYIYTFQESEIQQHRKKRLLTLRTRMQTRGVGQSLKYQEAIQALMPSRRKKKETHVEEREDQAESESVNGGEGETGTNEPLNNTFDFNGEVVGSELNNPEVLEDLPFATADLNTAELNNLREQIILFITGTKFL